MLAFEHLPKIRRGRRRQNGEFVLPTSLAEKTSFVERLASGWLVGLDVKNFVELGDFKDFENIGTDGTEF